MPEIMQGDKEGKMLNTGDIFFDQKVTPSNKTVRFNITAICDGRCNGGQAMIKTVLFSQITRYG